MVGCKYSRFYVLATNFCQQLYCWSCILDTKDKTHVFMTNLIIGRNWPIGNLKQYHSQMSVLNNQFSYSEG